MRGQCIGYRLYYRLPTRVPTTAICMEMNIEIVLLEYVVNIKLTKVD